MTKEEQKVTFPSFILLPRSPALEHQYLEHDNYSQPQLSLLILKLHSQQECSVKAVFTIPGGYISHCYSSVPPRFLLRWYVHMYVHVGLVPTELD